MAIQPMKILYSGRGAPWCSHGVRIDICIITGRRPRRPLRSQSNIYAPRGPRAYVVPFGDHTRRLCLLSLSNFFAVDPDALHRPFGFGCGLCPTLRMTYPCPTFKKPMCENTQIPIQLFTLTQCVNISRLPNGKHFTFAKANISHSPSEVSISRLPTANI